MSVEMKQDLSKRLIPAPVSAITDYPFSPGGRTRKPFVLRVIRAAQAIDYVFQDHGGAAPFQNNGE